MTTKTKAAQNLKSVSSVLEHVYRELSAVDMEASELSERNRVVTVNIILDPIRGGGRQVEREREVEKFEQAREKKIEALESRASAAVGVLVDLERADKVRRELGNVLRHLNVRI